MAYNSSEDDTVSVDWKNPLANGYVLQKLHGTCPGKPIRLYLLSMIQLIKGHVLSFLANDKSLKLTPETTIFSELTGGKLPLTEKHPRRLIDEANILVIAGGEAIIQSLTIISYHLVTNPLILVRLREELDVLMPNPDSNVTWCQLEKLPYEPVILSLNPMLTTSGCHHTGGSPDLRHCYYETTSCSAE